MTWFVNHALSFHLITSTGKNNKDRRYSPFTTSTEDKVPFRTITGRQSFYCDHEMMRDYGEAMALYKPVLSYAPVKGDYAQEGGSSNHIEILNTTS